MIAFFYLFAVIAVLACLTVITARNSVYAVLSLILSFFAVAGLFLLLGAEYLAMTLVIVYVGAVAVLFLFVVMMLNIDVQITKRSFVKYLPTGILLVGTIIALFLIAYSSKNLEFSIDMALPVDTSGISNTEQIARQLYTDYFVAFQVCGLILFAAMVGVIVLTVRHKKIIRRQNSMHQVLRTRDESVELLEVESKSGVKL